MKPFNLEEAKAGKPVQTRDGRDVEILRFDLRGDYPIAALVKYDVSDSLITYTNYGTMYRGEESSSDPRNLFMKSEKKEGWVVVLKGGTLGLHIYATKEQAESIGRTYPNFVTVAKIEWEE